MEAFVHNVVVHMFGPLLNVVVFKLLAFAVLWPTGHVKVTFLFSRMERDLKGTRSLVAFFLFLEVLPQSTCCPSAAYTSALVVPLRFYLRHIQMSFQ